MLAMNSRERPPTSTDRCVEETDDRCFPHPPLIDCSMQAKGDASRLCLTLSNQYVHPKKMREEHIRHLVDNLQAKGDAGKRSSTSTYNCAGHS